MKNKVGIVIVNYNNGDVLFPCLASLIKAGFSENAVVVDNGSSDGSIDKLKLEVESGKLRVEKIFDNRENLGFAGGNNKGIEYFLRKGKKYIVILNPDTKVKEDSLKILVEEAKKQRDAGILAPKMYDKSGNLWSCGGEIDKQRYSGGLIGLGEKDRGQYDQISNIDFASGTAMLVKREVFEKVGLFYQKYFIYYEDVELSLRARKSAFKVKFIPTSVVYHQESSSFGKDSPFHSYYLARNHLLFVERNAPARIILGELARLPKTIYQHYKKKEKWAIMGIKDYFLRRFGKSDYWD